MKLMQARKDISKGIREQLMKSPTLEEWLQAYQDSPSAQAVVKYTSIFLGIVLADYILRLPPAGRMLYILPVFYLTRSAGVRAGLLLAVVATIIGSAMDHLAGLTDTWLVNSVVRFTAMTVLAFSVESMVDRLKLTTDVARHDNLTGALNRSGFQELADTLISDALSEASDVVICVVDLDDFKSINDNYGHSFGDTILKTFVECAAPAIAEGGLIGRTGGDEFQILVTGASKARVDESLKRALNRFSDATLVLGHRATFSHGSACLHMQGTTLEQLVNAADKAMYQRKALRGRRSTDRFRVVVNA